VPQELRALPTSEAFASAEVVEELAVEPTAEAKEHLMIDYKLLLETIDLFSKGPPCD
jgi:hypothetical protein